VVPLADLVPHPDNPRGADVGDVAELAASIREHGVLEPLVVTSAAAAAASLPQLAEAAAGRRWVVVAGHRRRAGAAAHREAGELGLGGRGERGSRAPTLCRPAAGTTRLRVHRRHRIPTAYAGRGPVPAGRLGTGRA
jgi:hypothetical protein